MRTSLEQRQKQHRSIYEIMCETPRITLKEIAIMLDMDPRTISSRVSEALELKYIIGPQIRKKSYLNLGEYMYFIKCDNPELLYLKYREDQNIVYHAKTIGLCNLWIVAKEKIDIDGEILVEGQRSDYHVSYPPDHSWETAIEVIKKKIEIFKPQYIGPKNHIQSHFSSSISWTPEDELLYRYFKYDLRKPITSAVRELGIWERNIYNFFENLSETCIVFTDYYPESLSAYNPYLFVFETDYEDFIIELFSELPATSSFFKVSDKLFVNIHVPEKLARIEGFDPFRLSIPLLALTLKEKEIIKNKDYLVPEYYWSKDL